VTSHATLSAPVTRDAIPADSLPPMAVPGHAGHPLSERPLPFWLDRPCPAWCTGGRFHTDGSPDRERIHMSDDRSVTLTLEPAGELHDDFDPDVAGHAPAIIDVRMWQHYRDAEPHLQFIFNCDDEPRLTMAEGGALADLLAGLADRAGDLAGDAPGRPFWLPCPCPAWCAEKHGDGDHPDDRRHVGETRWVPLTMEAPFVAFPSPAKDGPEANWHPAQLGVALEQGWREAEARITVQYADDKYLDLTLAEARELAADIRSLLAGAR
jgi:hypothetical protein